MKMEVVLAKREDMEVVPARWMEKEEEEEEKEEEEDPATFDDTDDENPPDEAETRGRGAGRGETRAKLLRASCSAGYVKMATENEGRIVNRAGKTEMKLNNEKEKERETGGGGRLRHRCFLNHCRGEERGETHQQEEKRGGREERVRKGSESCKETARLKEDKENETGGDGGGGGEVKPANTCDDNGGDCVVHHSSLPSPSTITTVTCHSFVTTHPPPLPPSPIPPPPATTVHTLPYSTVCHRIPHQNFAATHPCQGSPPPMHPSPLYLPCQYHKQGAAVPYNGYGFRCVPCQAQCPYMCHNPQQRPVTPSASHHNANVIQAMQDTPASPPGQSRGYAKGIPATADAPSHERCSSLPSFSKDYITSLAFLARVDHVARVLAERSLPLKNLPQCPSPALCLLMPQPCHPSTSPDHHSDSCTHDLKRLQETLALCAGVGKGEVTPDLRHYCRSLLLAVLCPRSPPHEVLLVDNSIQELEGRAYSDHSVSQVKYCWRVASSLCLILERLGWVPSAQ